MCFWGHVFKTKAKLALACKFHEIQFFVACWVCTPINFVYINKNIIIYTSILNILSNKKSSKMVPKHNPI